MTASADMKKVEAQVTVELKESDIRLTLTSAFQIR